VADLLRAPLSPAKTALACHGDTSGDDAAEAMRALRLDASPSSGEAAPLDSMQVFFFFFITLKPRVE